MWFRQHARPRTQTEHSSHRGQYFCLCQRCDTCPNVWQKCVFFFSIFWVIFETCPNLVMTFVFKVLRNQLLRYILETCPNQWWRSCSKCYAIDCFGTDLKHVQILWWRSFSNRYTQSTASVQTWNMSKPVMTCVFKVLLLRLLRYILEHVQTCDDVRVQSATQSTASVQTWNMSESCDDVRFQTSIRNRLLRYRLETCPNLVMTFVFKPLYAIDCFGTDLKHVQILWWRSFSNRYTQSTASVQTWNMSKPVMTCVFKVLRNRLLRYRLETCPNLVMTFVFKPLYAIDCFGTDLKHVQTCDDVRVQSATQSTASVHTWNMSKPVMTFVFKVLRNQLLRYRLETCPNLWWRACSKCYAINCFGTDLKHVQTCDDLCVQSATQSTASVLETCSKPVVTFMAVSHMSIGIFLGPWSRMLCNLVKRCISCT